MNRDEIIILLQEKLKKEMDKDTTYLDEHEYGCLCGREELLGELIVEISNKTSGI